MKNTELFALLGEIDDKYFEEARLPDEEHGYEAIPDHQPFRGLMSILLPIAACIVIAIAAAVGAKLINGKNEVLPPDTGTTVSPSEITPAEGYPAISLADVPRLADGNSPAYNATLTSVAAGEYGVCLVGEDIRIKDDENTPILNAARLYLELTQNGGIIDTKEIRFDGFSPEDGYELWFDDLDSYLLHTFIDGGELIIFRNNNFFNRMLDIGIEHIFYSIYNGKLAELYGDHSAFENDSPVYSCEKLKFDVGFNEFIEGTTNTLFSNGRLYTFHPENFGADQAKYPSYTVTVMVDLNLYQEFSEALSSATPGETAYLPYVILGRKDCGEYTVNLVSSDMYVDGGDPEHVYADNVRLMIEKDGCITAMETIDTSEYKFPRERLTEKCLGVYDFGGRIVTVAALRYTAENSTPDTLYDAFFHTVESGYKLKPVNGIGTVSNKACLWNDFEVDSGNKIIKLPDRSIEFKENFDGSSLYFQTGDIMNGVDLSEYPEINVNEIPEIEDFDTENFKQIGLCMPGAKLAEKQIGGYTFTLIGEHIAKSGGLYRFRTLSLVITGADGGQTARVYCGSKSTKDDDFASIFPNIYEMKDGIVVELLMLEPSSTRFAGLKGNVFAELSGTYEGGFVRQERETTVDYENNFLLLGGTRAYEFHFDKIGTNEPQFTSYIPSTGAPGTVTEKNPPDFTVSLFEDGTGKVYIRVEWNGDKWVIEADNVKPLIKEKADEYLKTFNLEDGMGFAVYYDLDPESMNYRYASLYSVTDEEVIKLRYKYDYAPAPASGSPTFAGSNLAPSSGNVLISDECRITVDFESGTYDVEFLEDVSLSNYAEYDSSADMQEHVKLAEKASGNYRFALVCDKAENTEYAGIPAVRCIGAKLILASSNGHRIDAVYPSAADTDADDAALGTLYLSADGLSGYIQPFELESGTAVAFLINAETWANSLPSAIIYVVGESGLVFVGYTDYSQGLTADGNALVAGDTRIELAEYF